MKTDPFCAVVACSLTVLCLCPAEAATSTNIVMGGPLSLSEAIQIALRQSPNILRAQKELEAAQGLAAQTRAIVIPKIRLNGNYSAVQSTDVDRPPESIPGFTFGTEQSWGVQARLVQSLYEGGRMSASLRIARLTQEQSFFQYQTAVADTTLDVQVAFYDAMLAEQQIKVQEASVELLSRELADTTRRFEAGTVPRFNVLRAEVELANARPKLIRTRNSFRIAKNNLVNLLGIDLARETVEDIPLRLTGTMQAEPSDQELPRAIEVGLEQRAELGALRKAKALRQQNLITARASSKPSLQAFAGYDAHSSIFSSDLTREVHGWITGVQLNWDIFDGFFTQGKVKEAQALYERAVVDLEDNERKVELQVRTAFSNLLEARELVESQKKVTEQAEEALRLARARSEAGTGTQLDVLSAQTALTEARTTQIQALHDYAVAKARLDRSIGDKMD